MNYSARIFKGIPPKGGGLVGIDVGKDSGPTKFTFNNFQVGALPE